MESRWTIRKKDGSKVGPLLSSEVRDSLRKGRIDLYDWVYKENSKFTLRLIDTDEIFGVSSKSKDSIYKISEDPLNNDLFKEKTPETTKLNKATQQNIEKERANPKIYLITKDKKKFAGPVSAADIVAKYNHNKVKHLFVKQDGIDSFVKIEYFVKTFNAYADPTSRNVMLANLFKKRKSAKRLEELKESLNLKRRISSQESSTLNYYKIFGILAILAVLVTLIIFVYPILFNPSLSKKSDPSLQNPQMENIQMNNQNNMDTMNNDNNINNYDYTNNNLTTQEQPNNQTFYNFAEDIDSSIQITATPITPDNSMNKISSGSKSKAKNKTKPNIASTPINSYQTKTNNLNSYYPPKTSNLAKTTKNIPVKTTPAKTLNTTNKKPLANQTKATGKISKKTPPTTATTTVATKTKTNNTNKSKKLEPTISSPKPQQLLANNRSIKPQQHPNNSSSGSSLNSANKLEVGAVSTLYNMKFSKAELSLCSGKCDIEFYNNKLSVRGIFFKGAYFSTLNKKTLVNITGTISKKGSSYSMFIQKIE